MSDWSSDVCSSELPAVSPAQLQVELKLKEFTHDDYNILNGATQKRDRKSQANDLKKAMNVVAAETASNQKKLRVKPTPHKPVRRGRGSTPLRSGSNESHSVKRPTSRKRGGSAGVRPVSTECTPRSEEHTSALQTLM